MSTELLKYLLIGGINTLLTFILYYAMLQLGIPYLLALVVAWFLGILFTYTLNFVWVFKPEQQFTFHQRFWRYFTGYCLSLFLNVCSLHYLVSVENQDPFYAQIIIMPFIVGFNYLMTKFWSLRRWAKVEEGVDSPVK